MKIIIKSYSISPIRAFCPCDLHWNENNFYILYRYKSFSGLTKKRNMRKESTSSYNSYGAETSGLVGFENWQHTGYFG